LKGFCGLKVSKSLSFLRLKGFYGSKVEGFLWFKGLRFLWFLSLKSFKVQKFEGFRAMSSMVIGKVIGMVIGFAVIEGSKASRSLEIPLA